MRSFPHVFTGSPVFCLLLGLLTAKFVRGDRDAALEEYAGEFPFPMEHERRQMRMALDLLENKDVQSVSHMDDDIALLRNRLVLLLVVGNAERAEAEALEFLTTHYGCARELLDPLRPLLPYIASPVFHSFFERLSFR